MLNNNVVQSAQTAARIQSLSHARLRNYRNFFGATNDVQALALYQWNDELSSCLFRLLSLLEVILRNQFHRALSLRYGTSGAHGSKDWYAHVALSPLSRERITDITHVRHGHSRVLRVPAATPDDVVSKLTFGFWPRLLDLKLDLQLKPIDWGAILPEMLPGHRQRQVTHWVKRKHQDALFARLDLCNALRNRIAHHEPVWKLGPLMSESRARSGKPLIVEEPAPSGPTEALERLRLLYGRTTELLGWLSPQTAAHHEASELHHHCVALLQPSALAAYQHARPPLTIDIAKVANLQGLRKVLRYASRCRQPVLLKDGHRTLGRFGCSVG